MSINVTVVSGEDLVGLYAADGSYNVVDTTAVDPQFPCGIMHPCGAYNVTVVAGNAKTGLYAANGSLNVIEATGGRYHPCGAWNVTVVGGSF